MVLLKLVMPGKVPRALKKQLEDLRDELGSGHGDLVDDIIGEARDRRHS